MNYKHVLLIISVFAIILFGIYYIEEYTLTDTDIGDSSFSMPYGYKFSSNYTFNNSYRVDISNGTSYLQILKTNEKTSLNKSVEDYLNYYSNYTINVSKLPMDENIEVIKTETFMNNNPITKYYFIKDGDNYCIITKNQVSETDNVIKGIVNSIK